ncbi:MAG: right-handed parallel beta-helix repeat-containing protein [Paludibacter sp.]|nr:right-handed parallel beta-helix repeat-containing protein [Paludibacter sp.]
MKRFLYIIILLTLTFTVAARTFYVAVDGNDENPGTKEQPFAGIMRAQEAVLPGDTVFVRGGKYVMNENQIARVQRIWAFVHDLRKSGEPDKRIHYFAYPGEKPVFDFSNVKPVNKRIIAFNVTGSWIHFRGLSVTGVQVTILTHTQSECFHNEGSHNIYEQLSMFDGQAIGFYLNKGSHNLVLNCDAWNNADYTSEGGRGGNVDGFGFHGGPGDVGNVIRGCRAWFNSDDGYDLIRSAETVVIENCWAFYNGYSTDFESLGDGNGFKAGGWGLKKDQRVPDSIKGHVIRFCVAVGNKANGFYSNHHPAGNVWINNTAYRNGTNFNMLNRNADFTASVSGFGHKLINNLSLKARTYDTQYIDPKQNELITNGFAENMKVGEKDFKSIDESLLVAAREPDGSLPQNDFLRLKKRSKLINKGTEAGFPYKGKAPDLGAFEER